MGGKSIIFFNCPVSLAASINSFTISASSPLGTESDSFACIVSIGNPYLVPSTISLCAGETYSSSSSNILARADIFMLKISACEAMFASPLPFIQSRLSSLILMFL